MSKSELKKLYKKLMPTIEKRMLQFQETWNNGNESIWHELCFCILTANTSSRMALSTMEKLVKVDFNNEKEILSVLKQGYRFPNTRTNYILTSFRFLTQECGLNLKALIQSFGEDRLARRDYFARTPSVKGLSYKESSHFLRNIGFKGYAILDKHILRTLFELKIIDTNKPPRNRVEYIQIEQVTQCLADDLGISMDHLDFVLWYTKTGEVLK